MGIGEEVAMGLGTGKSSTTAEVRVFIWFTFISIKLTTSFLSFLWTQALAPVDITFQIVLLLHHPRSISLSHRKSRENQNGNPGKRLLPSHRRNVHHCRKPSVTMAVSTLPHTLPQ